MTTTIGFIAYPGYPPEIGQSIEAATHAHNQRFGPDNLCTWRESDIAGRFLITPIFDNIRGSKCLIADVSILNFNVTYEVGYAVGQRRRVFLIRNRSLAGSDDEIRRVGIFDTLGYQPYENARDLEAYFATLRNFDPLTWMRSPDPINPVYLLQFPFSTDAQNRIVARIKKTRLRYRSFDPAEMSRLSADEAIQGVAGSFGVVVPLAGSHLRDANIHNLRAAFVAGLAAGMERVTLLIRQGEDPVPLDYRDFVQSFKHPDGIDELIGKFALDVTGELQLPNVVEKHDRGLLANLDLGAPSAENEMTNLGHYYLQTDQFQRTLRGEARVVIGRKGAGKTAVFAQVRDKVRANRKVIVLDLRPEGYQLRKFKEQVLTHLEEGAKEHTITAFWEYLLLLEVTYKILEKDRDLHLRDHRLLEPYRALESEYSSDDYSQEGDFSERMLRLIERIADSFQDRHSAGLSLRLTRQQITEFLYVHDIRKLQQQVTDYLRQKEGLRILFDNLDKGWATNGVSKEDALIVKCLLEATRKLEQTLRPRGIGVHCSVFIRNDVYSLVVSETSDRSKETAVSLDWNNPDHLREMLLRRLRFNNLAAGMSFEEAWRTICVSHMPDGEETSQFLIERCLMRPRFLINLVNHCKSNAVNSGRSKIEHIDIEKGMAAYSTDLITDIGLEIRDVLPDAEDVLYQFLGGTSEIRAVDLLVMLELKYGAAMPHKIVETLIWYGLLGVVRPTGEAAFIHTVNYDVKRLNAMLEAQHESERRFHINPAFWAGLEIVPQPALV